MRAISLWEPWASAIAIGAKRIETRHWATDYRGPLAIHAAKTAAHSGYIFEPEVRSAFAAAGIVNIRDLKFGCVVAISKLVACVPTESVVFDRFGPFEHALGSYEPGRFAWILEDVVKLSVAVPARGAQGFWNWHHESDLLQQPQLWR